MPTKLRSTKLWIWEKTTAKNVPEIGKHSDLLKITGNPPTYARILEPDSKPGTYEHLHRCYEQTLIITFSRKMMEYKRYIRNKQIERAKKILTSSDHESMKKGHHDVTFYQKNLNIKIRG